MKSRPIACLVALLLLAAAAPASADFFQTFTGDTTNGPTFNRPSSGGVATTINVHYQAQTFILASAANCTIYSAQDYDGYLHLYQGSFSPGSPTSNFVAGDDDAELGVGTSRIPADLNTNSIALAAGTYILVTSAFSSSGEGTFENFIQCSTSQPLHGNLNTFFAGIPRDQQVSLRDRFPVAIDQISNHPTNGFGTPVRFGSSDSAFFWFFNARNFEVLVKVLNGCPINGQFWVFFAGTTNQAFRLRVADANTLQVETYNRSLGPPSPAETDTNAFPCP